MRRRQLVLVGGVACLALLACATAGRLTRPHPVNRTNFERIRVGMTRAEVEAILGCPPGDYSTAAPKIVDCGVVVANRLVVGDLLQEEAEDGTLWASNSGSGCVWFDKEGRVCYAQFGERWPEESPSLLSRLRAWLGW